MHFFLFFIKVSEMIHQQVLFLSLIHGKLVCLLLDHLKGFLFLLRIEFNQKAKCSDRELISNHDLWE